MELECIDYFVTNDGHCYVFPIPDMPDCHAIVVSSIEFLELETYDIVQVLWFKNRKFVEQHEMTIGEFKSVALTLGQLAESEKQINNLIQLIGNN